MLLTMLAVAAASTILLRGHVAGQHQLRVLLDVHPPLGPAARLRDGVLLSRRTTSAGGAAPRRSARAEPRGRARPGRVRDRVVPRVHVPRVQRRERRPIGVLRRLPARRPRDAARDRGRRASGLRHRPDPRHAAAAVRSGLRSYSLYLWHYPIFCVTRPRLDFDSSSTCTAGRCSCCGSCSRSARPSSRTASSRARSAAARSAGTASGCAAPRRAPSASRAPRRGRRGHALGRRASCSARASPTRSRRPDRSRGTTRPTRRRRPIAERRSPTLLQTRPRRSTTPGTTTPGASTPGRAREPASTTPTTTEARQPCRAMLAIGDSVMLGARGALRTRDAGDRGRRQGQPAVLAGDRRAWATTSRRS